MAVVFGRLWGTHSRHIVHRHCLALVVLIVAVASLAGSCAEAGELHRAAWRGQTQRILRLLEENSATEGYIDMGDPEYDGREAWSALHWAAYTDQRASVAVLAQHGATVDLKDANGVTPLMLAALRGHARVCDALLRAGADIDATANNGLSATGLVSVGREQHDQVNGPNRGDDDDDEDEDAAEATSTGGDSRWDETARLLEEWPETWAGMLSKMEVLQFKDDLEKQLGVANLTALREIRPSRASLMALGMDGVQAKQLIVASRGKGVPGSGWTTWHSAGAVLLIFVYIAVQRCIPRRRERATAHARQVAAANARAAANATKKD